MSHTFAEGRPMTLRAFRDVVTFLIGAGILVLEIVTAKQARVAPNIWLLGFGAALMGVPGTLGFDRLLSRPAPGEPAPPPEPPTGPPS